MAGSCDQLQQCIQKLANILKVMTNHANIVNPCMHAALYAVCYKNSSNFLFSNFQYLCNQIYTATVTVSNFFVQVLVVSTIWYDMGFCRSNCSNNICKLPSWLILCDYIDSVYMHVFFLYEGQQFAPYNNFDQGVSLYYVC